MFYKTFQAFYINCEGSARGLVCKKPVISRAGSNYSVKKDGSSVEPKRDFYVKPVLSVLSDLADLVKARY